MVSEFYIVGSEYLPDIFLDMYAGALLNDENIHPHRLLAKRMFIMEVKVFQLVFKFNMQCGAKGGMPR